MKGRALIPLVVGLLIGGVAIKGFLNVLKKAKGAGNTQTVEVVVAATDIAATVQVNESMVKVKSVASDLAPDAPFTKLEDVIGRVTFQTIPKGMPVAEGLLAPPGTPPGMMSRIKDGYRAVAIQVDEIVGVAGFIKPGTRVDVVIVMKPDNGRGSRCQSISRVILQNVEVLAAGKEIQTNTQEASVTRSVTVLVKPEDAAKLHLATTKGRLRLALRGADDYREPTVDTLTDKDLLTDSGPSCNGPVQPALLSLFNKIKKMQSDKDDTKTSAPVMKPATVIETPKSQEWVVEVMNGSEKFELCFESDKKDAKPLRIRNGSSPQQRPGSARMHAPVQPSSPQRSGGEEEPPVETPPREE